MTPATLRAAYDFLRVTRPFDRWGLPAGADVRFRVLRTRDLFGDYQWEGGRHRIRVSTGRCHYVRTVLATIAHEMCHMRQALLGLDTTHGKRFQRLWAAVCRSHGYDPLEG